MALFSNRNVRGGTGLAWVLAAIVGYGIAISQASVSGQQPVPANPAAYKNLPEGPGKTALVRMCSVCHELERVLAVRQTPQGWATILENMSQRGANGTDEEWNALFEYLSQHFTPGQGKAPADKSGPPPSPGPAAADGKVRSTFSADVTGGAIQMVATDLGDTATTAQIRGQLQDMVKRVKSGDYTRPPFLDAQVKPELESLRPFAEHITLQFEELPAGGKVLISATQPDAIGAVQKFIRAHQPPSHK